MPKFSFPSARAFDSGLAALAALSAGFVAFAMPESLFSSLVETSRLPDFVPAAQPPLGETARFATTAAAFLLTFALVWALMALLGRRPAPRKAEAEPKSEAPRLRRADAHPDAPARQPLLARDLGEPLDLDDFPQSPADEEPAFAEAEHRTLPPFLVPQEPEPELEPVAEAEPELDEPETGMDEPQPLWTPSKPNWAEPEPAPQAEVEPEARPLPLSALAAQLPQAEEAESGQSLSQLAGRIEFGLARKRQALPAAADLTPAEEMPAEQEKVGHRLRSAINDLQKIASSGG
ncbi:MAG: hypothetical protein QOJ91_338 [Sphingomonadales bacterium]|jgi:hypothetical protein|nr:hypothetical protein [Sphingomonadales bacterium]